MKTQKQQLLDYLAIHSSEAELLGLCRKIKDDYVAVEHFLKDVTLKASASDAPATPVCDTDAAELARQQNLLDDLVLSGMRGGFSYMPDAIADSIGSTVQDTKDSLERLCARGKCTSCKGGWSGWYGL